MSVASLFDVDVYDLVRMPFPCEHSQHERTHVPDQPASWLVTGRCTGCKAQRTYRCCRSGVTHMLHRDYLRCPCGTRMRPQDALLSITPLS